jgi:hypothetical protein
LCDRGEEGERLTESEFDQFLCYVYVLVMWFIESRRVELVSLITQEEFFNVKKWRFFRQKSERENSAIDKNSRWIKDSVFDG